MTNASMQRTVKGPQPASELVKGEKSSSMAFVKRSSCGLKLLHDHIPQKQELASEDSLKLMGSKHSLFSKLEPQADKEMEIIPGNILSYENEKENNTFTSSLSILNHFQLGSDLEGGEICLKSVDRFQRHMIAQALLPRPSWMNL